MAQKKTGKGKGRGNPKRRRLPRRKHKISVRSAAELTLNFRKYAEPPAEHGGVFHADQVMEMLSQPGAKGLRYYHARRSDGTHCVVLVATDEYGNDIVKKVPASTVGAKSKGMAMLSATDEDAIVLEMNFPCPPFCPVASPLNQ
jgi:hypothetical protein